MRCAPGEEDFAVKLSGSCARGQIMKCGKWLCLCLNGRVYEILKEHLSPEGTENPLSQEIFRAQYLCNHNNVECLVDVGNHLIFSFNKGKRFLIS